MKKTFLFLVFVILFATPSSALALNTGYFSDGTTTPFFMPGVFENGIQLTGTNKIATQYQLYTDAENVVQESGAIEFWLKPSSEDANRIASDIFSVDRFGFPQAEREWKDMVRMKLVYDGTNNQSIVQLINTNGLGQKTTWNAPLGKLMSDGWHYIVITWSKQIGLQLYYDGIILKLDPDTPKDWDFRSGSNLVIFGELDYQVPTFTGVVDEIRFSKTSRDSVEIASALNNGQGRPFELDKGTIWIASLDSAIDGRLMLKSNPPEKNSPITPLTGAWMPLQMLIPAFLGYGLYALYRRSKQ